MEQGGQGIIEGDVDNLSMSFRLFSTGHSGLEVALGVVINVH